MPKHNQFFITFRDSQKRDPNSYVEDSGKIGIEIILNSIHYNLGLKFMIAGRLATDNLWLVRNIPGEGDDDVESEADPIYRYGHYFKLDSAG